MPTTGDTYLDSLVLSIGRHASAQPVSADLTDWLIHAVMEASTPDCGIVISRAAVPIGNTVLLWVNPDLLDMLKYADQAAYAAALAVPGFVHADDLLVLEDHIRHKSTATYSARLKRGDNGQYRQMRIQGVTMAIQAGEYRLTTLRLV